MPTWTFKPTSKGLGANTTILAQAFTEMTLTQDSATRLRYEATLPAGPGPDSPYVLTLKGTGMSTSVGDVTGGTITSLGLTIAGQIHLSVTGLNLSAEAYNNLVIPDFDNIAPMEAFILRGNDRLIGTNLGDILHGQGGNDILSGNGGADQMTGGAGSDRLTGGLGSDGMTGGAGADQFVFDRNPALGGGTDTITDFASRRDRIFLDNDAFSALGRAGHLNPALFKNIGTGALDANDRIFYTSGGLFYDRDGVMGFASPVLIASMSSDAIVRASDIFIIG
jgi:Ca2+-binding RTX toxin-like protein